MHDIESGQTERRQHARYALHLVGAAEVLYRRDPGAPPGDPKAGRRSPFKVESVNISTGGCMLTFDTEVSAGDVIRIYFTHPETKSEIEIEAQIQWMRRNATSLMGRYVAGVSFKNIHEEALSGLLDYAVSTSPTPI